MEVLERVGTGKEQVCSVRGRQTALSGSCEEMSRTGTSLAGKIEDRKARGRPRQKYLGGLVRVIGGRMSAA